MLQRATGRGARGAQQPTPADSSPWVSGATRLGCGFKSSPVAWASFLWAGSVLVCGLLSFRSFLGLLHSLCCGLPHSSSVGSFIPLYLGFLVVSSAVGFLIPLFCGLLRSSFIWAFLFVPLLWASSFLRRGPPSIPLYWLLILCCGLLIPLLWPSFIPLYLGFLVVPLLWASSFLFCGLLHSSLFGLPHSSAVGLSSFLFLMGSSLGLSCCSSAVGFLIPLLWAPSFLFIWASSFLCCGLPHSSSVGSFVPLYLGFLVVPLLWASSFLFCGLLHSSLFRLSCCSSAVGFLIPLLWALLLDPPLCGLLWAPSFLFIWAFLLFLCCGLPHSSSVGSFIPLYLGFLIPLLWASSPLLWAPSFLFLRLSCCSSAVGFLIPLLWAPSFLFIWAFLFLFCGLLHSS
ncbi:hypothetical protein C7M84_018688, partial [Penaeus vannamei]